jgi:serine/threonine-protein kinase
MAGAPNPFRFNLPTQPHELVGRGPVVDHLVSELHAWNGDSHALIGGRRFGKSSLLLALEHALLGLGSSRADGALRVLPVRFSLHDVLPLDSPESFFRLAIEETLRALAAVGPLPVGAPPAPPTLQGFEEIVRRIAGARTGPLRVALLLDEMDSALGSPAVGALFGNLRSLISTGRVSERVRLVAAGAGRFRELDREGSPLFNVLTPIFLEALDETASRTLIARADGLDAAVADAVAAAGGGHPFILQFLLHHLHHAGAGSAGAAELAAAERRFLQHRGTDLEAWWLAVGPEGQRVYDVLSRTAEWMSAGEIGRALPDRPGGVQRGVEALCFHGLVVQRHDHREHRVGSELFRGWHRAAAREEVPSSDSSPAPITVGTVCDNRYEIRQRLGKGGMGEVFLAFDRATQQDVALKIVREDARAPGDDEALRQELVRARGVSHPNVCRVHDLAPSLWGPILVMEHVPGQTLHHHIREKKAQGGIAADEFRRIASQVWHGLAAIHAQGLVHGDLKPGNVMVNEERAVILDFGFAHERARSSSRRPGAQPDGGTPNYMSPERLVSGGASAEDDVYATALTLWEMWTCRVPKPGDNPRARPMRSQILFDVPSGLSISEVKQIFRGMNEDPQMRPQARQMRFWSPVQRTTGSIELPRERLDPGPPLGRGPACAFMPGAQALLVTYTTHAPEVVGKLLPLDKPVLTLGRRDDQDLVIPESTVSSAHAQLRWQQGSWVVEDQQSANGCYADPSYERKTPIAMVHGSEVQVGECRLKLVSFDTDSPLYGRALRYLGRRDGLSGLLGRAHLMKGIDEDGQFSDWYEAPMHVCRYELSGRDRRASDRPTIRELLALRKAAHRVVEITEMLLPSLAPVVAGRTGPLEFVVSMVGPTLEEARQVVEQVASQVQGLLPDTLELAPTLVTGEPGRPARHLID